MTGYSDGVPTHPAHFDAAHLDKLLNHVTGDVRDGTRVRELVHPAPDFVFHLAAQPLVRLSYEDPLRTLDTNFMGTVNVLEALRGLKSPCTAVMITSDKCYDNVEQVWGYRENDALGSILIAPPRAPPSSQSGPMPAHFSRIPGRWFASRWPGPGT